MIDVEQIKGKLRQYTDDIYIIDELTQIISIKLHEYSYKDYNKYQYKRLMSIVIKSVYIDYYRRQKSLNLKNKIISIEELSKYDLNIYSEEKCLINYEVLLSALDKLTENQRDVFLLRFYFSLKFKNIAQILNCSKNTALSHFHKAKLKLRECLTKDDLYIK